MSTYQLNIILLSFSSTSDFSIRLIGGKDNSSGRVEVTRDNITWGTICDDFWNDVNANVLCRQLGYRWGKVCITTTMVYGIVHI